MLSDMIHLRVIPPQIHPAVSHLICSYVVSGARHQEFRKAHVPESVIQDSFLALTNELMEGHKPTGIRPVVWLTADCLTRFPLSGQELLVHVICKTDFPRLTFVINQLTALICHDLVAAQGARQLR